MAIVISPGGLIDLLTYKLPYLGSLRIHLFKNNLTPTEDTILEDFVEANFDGYAAQDLDDWGAPFLNVDVQAQVYAGLHVWTATGGVTPNSIYGYYCTSGDDLLLAYSDRNAGAPVLIDAEGESYSVLPTFIEATYEP